MLVSLYGSWKPWYIYSCSFKQQYICEKTPGRISIIPFSESIKKYHCYIHYLCPYWNKKIISLLLLLFFSLFCNSSYFKKFCFEALLFFFFLILKFQEYECFKEANYGTRAPAQNRHIIIFFFKARIQSLSSMNPQIIMQFAKFKKDTPNPAHIFNIVMMYQFQRVENDLML